MCVNLAFVVTTSDPTVRPSHLEASETWDQISAVLSGSEQCEKVFSFLCIT